MRRFREFMFMLLFAVFLAKLAFDVHRALTPTLTPVLRSSTPDTDEVGE